MSEPMAADELAAIKARCDAATPGPWVAAECAINAGPATIGCLWDKCEEDYDNAPANADFCAAARTDIPRLVAEVERLQRELAAAKEAVECVAMIQQSNGMMITKGGGTFSVFTLETWKDKRGPTLHAALTAATKGQ